MNVYLKTLGCRLNEAEAMMWAKEYQNHGLNIVQNASDAQICVVNSCAVTSGAVSKSKKQARRLKKINNKAHVVLSGCFATLEEKAAKDISEVDQVISNQDKSILVKKTLAALGIPLGSGKTQQDIKNNINPQKNSRAFIKVQDGCRNRCSFCIVTIARGNEKSRPINEVVKEIREYESTGFKEIVISGIHLGGYGSDTGENLANLVEAILEKTTIKRIRLGSLEPWDIPDGFFNLWQNRRLMPHLHLPLQSGCNDTLKRMARRCMREDYENLTKTARKVIPNLNLTTDIIVGFPGETEEEWHTSKEFISRLAFGHIHSFPYSIRQGTRAASLLDQQSPDTKKKRIQELLNIAKTSKENFLKSQIGLTTSVLYENKFLVHDNQTFISGLSENFLRVITPNKNQNIARNQIHSCVPTRQVWAENEAVLYAAKA